MNGYTQNRAILLLLLLLLILCSCNVPSARKESEKSTAKKYLWNLNIGGTGSSPAANTADSQHSASVRPTPTPQLYQEIDFDSAFRGSEEVSVNITGTSVSSGDDAAQWAFFDPVEYSSSSLETLYAAFDNTGSSVWNRDYYLEYYAGIDPSEKGKISLDMNVQPGERGTFSIPIKNQNASWKGCWKLKNAEGAEFYEFCYNHGTGQNANSNDQGTGRNTGSPYVEDVAAGVPGKEGYWAFQRTNGTAPSRYSDKELSADLVSTSPKNNHTFKAYDHFENITVTFRNNGSTAWDSSFALVFYSGYNWTHETRISVPGSVGPGENAVITMPMEIIEDNDTWVTCWYLSSPDGKNLYDFCFNYYTKS